MKRIKSLYFLLVFLVSALAYAQEAQVPLTHRFNPNFTEKNIQKTLYKSSNKSAFPLCDYFNKTQYPDTNFWSNKDVQTKNNEAIFDALDYNNIVYGNSDHLADELHSQPMDLSNYYSNAFFSFTFRSGSDFSSGDSLLLQGMDYDGNWQTIWRSPYIFTPNAQQLFGFTPTAKFRHKQFQIRFIAYSEHLNDTIVDLFRIGRFNFSQMLQPGFFELFKVTNANDSSASFWNWSQEQNRIISGDSLGFSAGKVAIFDNQTSGKQIYFNADGFHHYLDTLTSNPFDLQNISSDDSLRLSFLISGNKSLTINDTLYLEFRNRLGQWQRVWSCAGNNFQHFYYTVINISQSSFRNRFFQFRFINAGVASANDIAAWYLTAIAIQKSLPLPLIDEFSYNPIKPRTEFWVDENVYINNTFSNAQPSQYVATFDGLDKNGNAYTNYPSKGIADVLTSIPIDLSRYKIADSLYLSFQFQYVKQGTDESIFPNDSFIVSVRTSENSPDSFVNLWSASAADTINAYTRFTKVNIPIKNSELFHKQFQIRFSNYGSLTGNLSQWNLDYVRLNVGRSKFDTLFEDVAICRSTPGVLKKYSSMPYNHYLANTINYTQDSSYLTIHNNGYIPYPVDYTHIVWSQGKKLAESGFVVPSLFPDNDTTVLFTDKPDMKNLTLQDTIEIIHAYKSIYSHTKFDKMPYNDTFYTKTYFSNYFAYDDGTAEAGYGIRNKTNCGGALAFDLEFPDSLYGFYVFFNQSEQNVSGRIFNLNVWDHLSGIDGYTQANDDLRYKFYNVKPVYENQVNGFAYFELDSALAVSNRFYIGWDQYASFMLNIGFDKSYRNNGMIAPNPNQFYKSDGVWNASEIPGTMMIRAVVGKKLKVPTAIKEIKPLIENIVRPVCYPNPSQQLIKVQYSIAPIHIQLLDLKGNIIRTSNNHQQINIEGLSDGLYLLKIQDLHSGKIFIEKIIKN